MSDEKQNYCYILYNRCSNKTYVGYTNNPKRRIRQHNGELSGGARYTTSAIANSPVVNPWDFAVIITTSDAFEKRTALSLEWYIKYVSRKAHLKKGTLLNRLNALVTCLMMEKYSGNDFVLYVNDSCIDMLTNICEPEFASTIIVMPLNEILGDPKEV
jgi:predicted GIY-YIG superfamily endonuclease